MKRKSYIMILKIPALLLPVLILLCAASCNSAGTQNMNTAIPDDFILVEGGTFQMGDEKGDILDNCRPIPLHMVTVESFTICRYEVTQALYKKVAGYNPSCHITDENNPGCLVTDGDNHPVEKVSWFDAIEFCNKLSKSENRIPAYDIEKNGSDCSNWTVTWNKNANGYRLPTEAEWEYAARGGNKSNVYLYSGSDDIHEVAWFGANTPETTKPVGGKMANELGIFDMSGNVWEWCWDWYGDYSAEAQSSPDGPSSGEFRIRRGGTGYSADMFCRVALRSWYEPEKAKSNFTGFRLVLPCP